MCRNCSIKGHYEKVCMKGKSTHLVNVSEASTSSTNSEPDYFNEHGDPVYAHMANVKEINWKKHLIQFPIGADLEKVRNSMENSTKCPTTLLKADTGSDVNLMNTNTFDTLIKDRTILQPSSLRMEVYGNSAVEVFGKFHAFLRWKGCVYRQLFYVTNANDLPNLLSWDSCYISRCDKALLLCGNYRKFQQVPSSNKKPTWPKVKLQTEVYFTLLGCRLAIVFLVFFQSFAVTSENIV